MMFWGYPVRAWLAAFALGCLGLVGFGLYLQEAYRLAPCPLCIFQRLLYLLAAGLGLAGAVCPRAAKAVPLTLVPVANPTTFPSSCVMSVMLWVPLSL